MKLNTIRKARRDLLNTLKDEAKSRSANALVFVDAVYSGLDLEDTWTNVRKVAFEGEADKLGSVKDFYKDNGVSAAVAGVMYERMTKALRARFELKSKAKTLGGLVAVYDRHFTETAAESRGEKAGNRKGSAPKAHEYDIAAIAAFCTEQGISKAAIAKILRQDFLDGLRKLVA